MDKNQDLDKPFENLFGFTNVHVLKISYEWKIHNFHVIGIPTGDCLKSSQFSTSDYENIKWCLSLYPKGYVDNPNFLSLFLGLESNPENLQLETKCEFSILDKNRKKCFVRDYMYTFIKNNPGHGFFKYVLRKKILNDQYLPNGCLTIVCNITAGLDKIITKNGTIFNNIMPNEKPQLELLNDYGSLLNNQKLCDVTIVISDKKLHAHKAILAAHSPVFMNMFVNDTIENCKSTLEITDIELKVFKELLRFIYSGKIESTGTVVNDLLVAADKYLIGGLLLKCEQYLQSILNVDNIIDILVLADNHNAKNLRANAIKYFIAHKKDIIDGNNLDFLDRLKSCTVKEIFK